MSDDGDNSMPADAPTAVATNAVREQQRRLVAELAPRTQDAPAPSRANASFESVLCDVLASIEWCGERHRIFEALPHLEPILSFRMLRTVLARLGVSMVPIERSPGDLSERDLPSLVVEREDDSRLFLLGASGNVDAYDLRNGSRIKADRSLVAGVVYLIRVGEAEDAVGSRPPRRFVGHLLKQMRGSITRIMGYSAAINLVSLALSLYVLLVYDVVIATQSLDTLIFLAAGAFAAVALEWHLRHARSRAIAYLAARFDGVVAAQTLAVVFNMPLALTERAPITSQLTRFRQFEIGRELFAGNFASALFDLPFTLMFVIALFLIGGVLGFVPIGLSLLIVISCALLVPISAAQISAVGVSKLKSDTLLLELMDKLRTIRNASAESIWLARYAGSLATHQHARFANLQLVFRLQTVTGGLVGLAGIVTLGVGALRVMNASMSLGELIAAMMIVWRVLVPIQVVSINMSRIRQILATARQINDVSRTGNERKREMPLLLSRRLNGNILASGVYLSLGTQSEPQLRGINLAIKPGEIVAITGPSGSGKSTLLKLILGLYPQYIGTVRFDGLDLRQLDPAEVRMAIGYASQQPAFFYGSIAANFRFASPNASDAEIIGALAAVGVLLPNPALPDGLGTRISGSGARALPHGLLCRLSIARALVKQPPILLFDDPGHGLDRAGDAALMAHLHVLRQRSTVLLVTARPSHMRLADRVIEMRGGVISAEGPPETIVPRILARMTEAV
jgi:ATP-binding cassette, subfamily C, bacterial LapB